MSTLRRSAGAFLVLALIVAWQRPSPPPPALDHAAVPNIAELAALSGERLLSLQGALRPPVPVAVSPHLADRVSPPVVLETEEVVSKHEVSGADRIPYVLPRSLLPFRYRVEAGLADRFGLTTIIGAVSAWDGIPGSAWATEFAGVERGPLRRARADGVSVVFQRSVCPAGWLGSTHWNLANDATLLDARYGESGLYVREIDIGVCPRVATEDQLVGTLVHEIGHAMGMAHLCEGTCDVPHPTTHHEGDDDERGCRPMRPEVRRCGVLAGADRDAARHLHPTLARLAGPSPAETAARASYALTDDHSSPSVVLVALKAPAPVQLVAASLAASMRAPFLLAETDATHCLMGAAAEELARAAAPESEVFLVGTWPSVCAELLAGWRLRITSVDAAHMSALAVKAAERMMERGAHSEVAFVIPAGSGDPLGAGLPVLGRGPVLLSGSATVAPMVTDWLASHPEITQIVMVGGGSGTETRLRQTGAEILRFEAGEPATALAVAGDPLPGREEPVVLAASGAWTDGLVAATVAARTRGVFLPTSHDPDPAIERWLRASRPLGGFVVGDTGAIPPATQRRYGVWVTPTAPPSAVAPRGSWPLPLT